MPEVKHCLLSEVKHCLIPEVGKRLHNKAVLEATTKDGDPRKEARLRLATKLVTAMDTHQPPVTSVAVAKACGVTPQAVNGWRKTGRLTKGNLRKIADLTHKPIEYFLSEEFEDIATNYGLVLKLEEAEAIKRLQKALPGYRAYVLGLAMVDSKEVQQLLLDTMTQQVSDRRVEQYVTVAPHVAARKRNKLKQ